MAKLDANENLHPVPKEMMVRSLLVASYVLSLPDSLFPQAAVTEALSSLSSGCSAQIYPDPTQATQIQILLKSNTFLTMPVQINFRGDIAKMHGLSMEQVLPSAFRLQRTKHTCIIYNSFHRYVLGAGQMTSWTS